MPYGNLDIGESLSNQFQGGGGPQEGINVGTIEIFTFSLIGTDLSNLNFQDFL